MKFENWMKIFDVSLIKSYDCSTVRWSVLFFDSHFIVTEMEWPVDQRLFQLKDMSISASQEDSRLNNFHHK